MCDTTQHLRRFPATLRHLRLRRGMPQKAFALDLGITPTVLCGVEKGARVPLDDLQLTLASKILELNTDERELLQQAAHHDRLVHQMGLRGATKDELILMSSCLVAWQHMSPQQRTAWLANVQQLADRGEQFAQLARRFSDEEVPMA